MPGQRLCASHRSWEAASRGLDWSPPGAWAAEAGWGERGEPADPGLQGTCSKWEQRSGLTCCLPPSGSTCLPPFRPIQSTLHQAISDGKQINPSLLQWRETIRITPLEKKVPFQKPALDLGTLHSPSSVSFLPRSSHLMVHCF